MLHISNSIYVMKRETLFSHDSRVPLRLTATRGRSSNYATLSQIYSRCNNGRLFDENSSVYHCSYFGLCFYRLDYSLFKASIKQFKNCLVFHAYLFYCFIYFVTSNLSYLVEIGFAYPNFRSNYYLKRQAMLGGIPSWISITKSFNTEI